MNKLKEKTNILPGNKMFKYTKTADLPDDWDENCQNNHYLKRSFLEFTEKNDKSEKNYYAFRTQEGKIDTQFLITKTLDNNIAMFTPFKFAVKMNAIYFPFSISSPAGIFGNRTKKDVENFLKTLKGFTMIVNLEDEKYTFKEFSQAVIPPKCIFYTRWNSFEEYISKLRSGYRRRYNTALRKSEKLKLRFLKNNKTEFTDEMYNLYLDIYNKAEYKLGKIPIDYFRREEYIIFTLEDEKNIQGFAQLSTSKDKLTFEYTGFNKKDVIKYDTYIKILLEIIRFGIENGYKSIDMGQTTDETKLKLGCSYKMLYALIRHSNPIINRILQKTIPYIQYKPLEETKYHVFKTK